VNYPSKTGLPASGVKKLKVKNLFLKIKNEKWTK